MTSPTAPSDDLLVKARDILTFRKERGLGEPMMVRDLCNELEREREQNAALREELAQKNGQRGDPSHCALCEDPGFIYRDCVIAAATAMRDLCVERVKEMGQVWKGIGDQSSGYDEKYFYGKADAADDIETELESLTLDQVEQKRK